LALEPAKLVYSLKGLFLLINAHLLHWASYVLRSAWVLAIQAILQALSQHLSKLLDVRLVVRLPNWARSINPRFPSIANYLLVSTGQKVQHLELESEPSVGTRWYHVR
jgi:hypothetical protein